MHRFFANQPLTHSHKTKSQISSNCLLALSCLFCLVWLYQIFILVRSPELMWCFQLHCFYFYTLSPSLILTLVCALLFHSSLSLTLPFSLSCILSCILSHFLAHTFTSTWYSPLRVVLPHLSLSFVVSFTPFLYFLVLIDFVWVDFHSLVLFSLSTRGMFSYLCMLGMLSGRVYHRFRVSKFFGRKNFK